MRKTYFAVSTFNAENKFDSYKAAKEYFDAVKKTTSYCELKVVALNAIGYYSKSIEISW